MKLDINRIAELEAEANENEVKANEVVKEAKRIAGSYEFNDWYKIAKDELSRLDDRREEIMDEIAIIKATNIEVGDGISLSPYSDWDAFTVIARRETPKGFVLTIQEDKAIRTDCNGMSDAQTYRYERNPEGITREVKWNTKKNWFTADGYRVRLGRHSFYDYTF